MGKGLSLGIEMFDLAIDLGTRGLSAVLYSRSTHHYYPIQWFTPEGIVLNRIPLVSEKDNSWKPQPLKAFLNWGLPYYSSTDNKWHPQLTTREGFSFSCYDIQGVFVKLFSCFTLSSPYTVLIEGQTASETTNTLQQISRVIFNCPAGWSDTYQFHLREIVLRVGLVSDPSSIIFVEDTIALFLSYFSQLQQICDSGERLFLPTVLLLNFGVMQTEIGILSLLPDLNQIDYSQFKLSVIPYGLLALEQDILSQLLIPQWMNDHGEQLAECNLSFPSAGSLNSEQRNALYWQLQETPLNRSLHHISQLVYKGLKNRSKIQSHLGEKLWTVEAKDFQERVIQPFLLLLRNQISSCLKKYNLFSSTITHLICTGGGKASLFPALEQELQNLFPQAQFLKQLPETAYTLPQGLMQISSFPRCLNISRHQYSEYFLLQEFLKIIPPYPFTLEQLWTQLKLQGINPRFAKKPLENFLNNQLPLGLIPQLEQFSPFRSNLQSYQDYQTLQQTPWITLDQENQYYHPNPLQCQRLRTLLTHVFLYTEQTCSEPLTLN